MEYNMRQNKELQLLNCAYASVKQNTKFTYRDGSCDVGCMVDETAADVVSVVCCLMTVVVY